MQYLSSNQYKQVDVAIRGGDKLSMPADKGLALIDYVTKNDVKFVAITTLDGDTMIVNSSDIKTIKPVRKMHSTIDNETIEAAKLMREKIGRG